MEKNNYCTYCGAKTEFDSFHSCIPKRQAEQSAQGLSQQTGYGLIAVRTEEYERLKSLSLLAESYRASLLKLCNWAEVAYQIHRTDILDWETVDMLAKEARAVLDGK